MRCPEWVSWCGPQRSEPHLLDRWYAPWVDLARSLGFADLADALHELAAKRVPCEWHAEPGITRAVIARRLSLWFSRAIFPIVEETKQRCVRGLTLLASLLLHLRAQSQRVVRAGDGTGW